MVKEIMAKILVHSAKKGQPGNYITILYSPESGLDFDSMGGGGTPHWILCVKGGEAFRAYWDRSGNVLKAIAIQANNQYAREKASKVLSSYEIQGKLWQWRTAFLPTEPP